MISQITDQVTDIFESQLSLADSCFTDFRISVNADEKRIPELERQIADAESMLRRLETAAN